jgi:hypothetical protein
MMGRENSFSDSDKGQSATPDLDEAEQVVLATSPIRSVASMSRRVAPASQPRGKARFRAVVKKVMAMHQTSHMLRTTGGAGAEPGVDPRRRVQLMFELHHTDTD